jgi:hypothetical protein
MRLATFLLLTMAAVSVNAETVVQPRYTSFLNDPTVEGARLATVADDWRLSLRLKFMNEYVADAGVRVEYLDVPLHHSDRSPSLRLVFVLHRVNPRGSPDIFQPVTRRVEVAMRRSDTIRTLVLLNSGSEFANAASDLRVHLLDVATAAGGEAGGKGPVLRAMPWRQDALPTLDGLSLSTARQSRGVDRLTVEFEAIASDAELAGGIAASMYEDPPRGEDGDLYVWLIVYASPRKRTGGETVQQVRKGYRLTTEIGTEYRRKLVIVNRLPESRETQEQPFTVLDVR